MPNAGEFLGGAALGAAFGPLPDLLMKAMEKWIEFKPTLTKISSTLEALNPVIAEIAQLDTKLRPTPTQQVLPGAHVVQVNDDKVTKDLMEKIVAGTQLVAELSEVRGLMKPYYTIQLVELDESLQRLLQLLKVQAIRDVKKNRILAEEHKGLLANVATDAKQILDLTTKNTNQLDEVAGYGKEILDLTTQMLAMMTQQAQADLQNRQEGVREQIQENVAAAVHNQLDIKDRCSVPELPPDTVVGFDDPLRELKKMFLADDVSMLVLTAHGGSGKTTLATKFCHDKDVKDKFKNNIFFVTVSKKPNVEVVQELYQRMDPQEPTFQSEEIAVRRLKYFLKETGQNPLLLVLDDVWPRSKSLLQKFDELKMPNTKILVTSRSEFPEFCTPYRLKSLNDRDSMTLFHHWADLGNRSTGIPEDLLKKIVEHCNGFPLAIKVIGTSLRGKPIEFWLKSLNEWSKGSILDSAPDLLGCLQSSLDALDEKDMIKEYFMDLGSFPEDQIIPAAAIIDMWAELYRLDEDFLSVANLHELISRSLANLVVTRKEKMERVDDYYVEHFVTQHDMLRELAIYNANQDPIEQRKRLIVEMSGDKEPEWLTEQKSQPINARLLSISSDEVFSTKWQSIQLPEVEVLVLNFQTKIYTLPEFVEKIDKLKVVIVTNYGFVPAELSNFQLLGSLPNLKRIRLERISIPSITKSAIPLKSLKKISIFMCNIGQAFSNCSIKISEALPKLEEMNIDFCHDLVELPAELGDLVCLKKLSITNCHKLSALPEEIGNLVKLKVLRLRSCTDLVKLPASIKYLTELDTLDISDCFSIKELPEEFGELSGLTKLNMRQCSRLKELPLSVIELEQLQEVICDDDTESLWERFLPSLINMRIKTATANINLDWLHKLPV